MNSNAGVQHRKLNTQSTAKYNEAVDKVIKYTKERGNPYINTAEPKLRHFTSDQLVLENSSNVLLSYINHGQAECEVFWHEHIIEKQKKAIPLSVLSYLVFLPEIENRRKLK